MLGRSTCGTDLIFSEVEKSYVLCRSALASVVWLRDKEFARRRCSSLAGLFLANTHLPYRALFSIPPTEWKETCRSTDGVAMSNEKNNELRQITCLTSLWMGLKISLPVSWRHWNISQRAVNAGDCDITFGGIRMVE